MLFYSCICYAYPYASLLVLRIVLTYWSWAKFAIFFAQVSTFSSYRVWTNCPGLFSSIFFSPERIQLSSCISLPNACWWRWVVQGGKALWCSDWASSLDRWTWVSQVMWPPALVTVLCLVFLLSPHLFLPCFFFLDLVFSNSALRKIFMVLLPIGEWRGMNLGKVFTVAGVTLHLTSVMKEVFLGF